MIIITKLILFGYIIENLSLKSYFNTYNKLFNEILKLLFITKYVEVILLCLNILRKTHLFIFIIKYFY